MDYTASKKCFGDSTQIHDFEKTHQPQHSHDFYLGYLHVNQVKVK